MQVAILFATLLITSSASLLGSQQHRSLGPAPATDVRLLLKNHEDMVFTSSVVVSGETVDTIMDTGSFEIVLFLKGCEGCMESSTYFDPKKAASDYQDTGLQGAQSYGSGQVSSTADFATVEVKDESGDDRNDLRSTKQLFWLAGIVDMDMELNAEFGGIFGLGPPASARVFAEKSEAYVKDALSEMSPDEAQQYQNILDEVEGVAKLEKETSPFLQLASEGVFSICLLPGEGSNGYLIFNDQAPQRITSWIPTTNSGFWEVPITDIMIGSMQIAPHSPGSCSAIMDSGTSLIGVPEEVYTEITSLVSDLVEKNGGCDELSSWPDFTFKVDGKQLSLPPSSYVALYDWTDDDDWDDSARVSAEHVAPSRINPYEHFMPHLTRARAMPKREGDRTCEAMVFSLGMDELGDGCQFLFGLPIFREYYISHRMDKKTAAADAMAFLRPGAGCHGLSSGDDVFVPQPVSNRPLVVKPKKIRFPEIATKFHWQSRAQKMLTKK